MMRCSALARKAGLRSVRGRVFSPKTGAYSQTRTFSTSVTADRSGLSGFHARTVEERKTVLGEQLQNDAASLDSLETGGLSLKVADAMIENVCGLFHFPFGVVPSLTLNGKQLTVPMVTEEPSVVAAASSLAKVISTNSAGFIGTSTEPVMTTQIQLLDVPVQAIDTAIRAIEDQKQILIDLSNEQYCPSMKARGGGVVDITVRKISPRDAKRDAYIVVHTHVDVRDSMGANAVDGIAEGLSDDLIELVDTATSSEGTQTRAGLRILTNLCTRRTSKVTFEVPTTALAWKGVEGPVVARKLMEAYYFACDDIYRAVTHNKGTMNGIDAVAIATGQDWRAIEAAAHSYHAFNTAGQYGPITHYRIENEGKDNESFIGEIELPMAVGTVGGSITVHPTCQTAMKLLGQPNSNELSQVMLAVGLAQNLAAMRALAIEGIQKGHMALHKRKQEKLADL